MDTKNKVAEILKVGSQKSKLSLIKLALSCVDLTTLNGSDTDKTVIDLCEKGRSYHSKCDKSPNVAAICVYPTFAKVAKECLIGSDIHVATVAGAFPAGQSPIEVKVAEVKYAVKEGADEIDMVISRGKFLEGKYEEVFNEIATIKTACGQAHLKVILETGELLNDENIRKASEIAIAAGGDFIKTSTGKIPIGATLEAFHVMCCVIKEHYTQTGQMIGIKPAGGVSTIDDAIAYITVLESVLGDKWLDKRYFRIGASRLADSLFDEIIKNSRV